MKILCPIDFSETSVNASRWAAAFASEFPDAKLELAHFIFFKRRAGMFLHIDEIFRERAEEDFEQLTAELKKNHPNLEITSSIFSANPKDGIVNVAKSGHHDYIIVGSTGLTALKNMTIGSVTEYIIKNSKVPALAIPPNTKYTQIKSVALAVDDELIENLAALSAVKDLCVHTKAKLHVIHVAEPGDSAFEYDPGVDMYFRNMDYKYEKLSLQGTLTSTINGYCRENNMDVLCMVHHKRNWIQKILSKSVTKRELFNLELPFLVIGQ